MKHEISIRFDEGSQAQARDRLNNALKMLEEDGLIDGSEVTTVFPGDESPRRALMFVAKFNGDVTQAITNLKLVPGIARVNLTPSRGPMTKFEESLVLLTTWLAIRDREGKLDSTNLQNDLGHSALLRYLTTGHTPWEVPPPQAFSYPWYDLLEHQLEEYKTYGEIWHASKHGLEEDAVYIHQHKWDVVETHSKYIPQKQGDWTLTPSNWNGGGHRCGKWRVTILSDREGLERQPDNVVNARFVRIGDPIGRLD